VKEISWILNDDIVMETLPDGKKKLINNDYIELVFQETLGKGRFCKVKKALGAYPKFGEKDIPYAIKIFNKQQLKSTPFYKMEKLTNMLAKSDDEITLQGKFDHPNVCKTFIAFDHGEHADGFIYLLMQIGDLGSVSKADESSGKAVFSIPEEVAEQVEMNITDPGLKKEYAPFCKNMKEKIVQFIFADVASGLRYLHHPELRVANRDIKPENIVFTTEDGGTSLNKRDRAMIVDFTTSE
jgi:serine/threonine protein kinase